MLLKVRISILFLVLFFNVSAYTQIQNLGSYFIENYHRSDYQAGNQNWDVQQGNNGMMYFANNNGLLEFDGCFWNLYSLPDNTIVRCINIDNNGRIYTGGFNEFGYFEKENIASYKFHSLVNLLPEDAKNFEDVWKIILHPEGIIFQSFNQLMIFNDSTIKVIPAPSKFHFSFFVNNEYYIYDMEKGLMKYAMGNFIPLNGLNNIKGKEISGVLEYKNKLYISTSSDGVFVYDGNSLKAWDNDINNFLKKNQIYCSYKTLDGNFAFGTIQNGLLISTSNGVTVKHVNMNDGLQNNTILSISEDYQGNLWLGTDHGIDYIENNSPLLSISSNYGISTGYAANINNGILYLGTNQGLFYKKINSINTYSKKFDIVKNTGGQVWSLTKIDNSLFCGHNCGALIIKGNKSEQISDIQGAWKFLKIPGIDNKVIGGTYSGLVLYEKSFGEWKLKKQYPEFSESARQMLFDNDGSLWMLHGYRGIYHFFFSDDYESIENIEFYNSENFKLSKQLFGLGMINNKIVFLTGNGAVNFSPNDDDFIPDNFFKKNIGNDFVRAFNIDKNNNIWYFTTQNTGVLRICEDNRYVNVSLPFKQLDGQFVSGFEFVYTYNEKNVFLATENGFVNYKPKIKKNYDLPFKTYLKSIYLFNTDSTKYFSDTSVVYQINYSNNHIEFSFSSNNFNNSPGIIMYSTFLEGFEENWSGWYTKNLKEYTNLNEGEYVFNVRAKNIYGEISKIESVSFIISPPFKRSVGALIIYFFILITLIIIGVIMIRKRINKLKIIHHQKQQELFRKKENALKRDALETEKKMMKVINTQLRQGIKQKDKELADSTLETIHKNEILINLRDELKISLSSMETEKNKSQLRKMVQKMNKEINSDKQWKVFESHFESVHEEFLERIKNKYPTLTPRELKLCAYLRMNISSKEISLLMNISLRGVEISRYRLRKKLNLERKVNLTDFILSF